MTPETTFVINLAVKVHTGTPISWLAASARKTVYLALGPKGESISLLLLLVTLSLIHI